MEIEEYLDLIEGMLSEVNTISVCARLALALILGGILGIERRRKKRPAGFRTYSLVCIGSALVMITNQFIFEQIDPSVDVVRMGAQVVSGIGFLCGGTILVQKNLPLLILLV